MAGDWIKMRADLPTSPKVVRMASALKADRLRIVGGLHSAWCLFDSHTETGQLEGYTLETVDDLLCWPGFASAMVAVGWLEETAQGVEVPRFSEHNGKSAKRRCMDSERKRSGRMSASEADSLRTREEKRREEVNQDQKPLSPPSADDEEVAKQIKFTTVSEIYNRVCGDVLPRCEALNPKRKTNIRNLCALKIRGGFPFRDSEFWEGYFNDCLTNPYWIGQNDRGWRADLEFLTRTEIALKVLEAA